MSRRAQQKVFGILGGDLSHTLSPLIHTFLFKEAGLDCSYETFEVRPGQLRQAVDGIRVLGIGGVNVTFPYKEEVIPHLDRLDANAEKTGAVNTIKNTRGRLTGYNTDVYGLRSTLDERMKIDLAAKTAMILGAGGAARACLRALLPMRPARVLIVNRTFANARTLAADIGGVVGKAEVVAVSLRDIGRHGLAALVPEERIGLLINATSASPGLTRKTISALSRRGLLERTTVLDLNYDGRALSGEMPAGTSKYVDGLYMLCAQATESFRIWTGIRPDAGRVHRAVRRHLLRKRKKR